MHKFINKVIWCLPLSGGISLINTLASHYHKTDWHFFYFFSQEHLIFILFNNIIFFIGQTVLALYLIKATRLKTAKSALIFLSIANGFAIVLIYMVSCLWDKNRSVVLTDNYVHNNLLINNIAIILSIMIIGIFDIFAFIVGIIQLLVSMFKSKIFPVWVIILFTVSILIDPILGGEKQHLSLASVLNFRAIISVLLIISGYKIAIIINSADVRDV